MNLDSDAFDGDKATWQSLKNVGAVRSGNHPNVLYA